MQSDYIANQSNVLISNNDPLLLYGKDKPSLHELRFFSVTRSLLTLIFVIIQKGIA